MPAGQFTRNYGALNFVMIAGATRLLSALPPYCPRRKPPAMPIELVWSNQARTELLNIYVLIGLERPATAKRYLDRIVSKVELLARVMRHGQLDSWRLYVFRAETSSIIGRSSSSASSGKRSSCSRVGANSSTRRNSKPASISVLSVVPRVR
jgi:plasmid stabilization system protein ParE